jgi:hypothetical protein
LFKIGNNSTLPVTISSIRLIGAKNTRRHFLDRLFDPLISTNKDRPYTLVEALNEVGSVADKLRKFGLLLINLQEICGLGHIWTVLMIHRDLP